MAFTISGMVASNEEIKTFIKENTATNKIRIGGLGIRDLDWLLQLSELESVYLQGFYHSGSNSSKKDTIQSFSGLAQLKKLRNIEIYDCQYFDNNAICIVSRILSLKRIKISSFMQTIDNFIPLITLTELEELDLSCYWRIENKGLITRIFHGRYADNLDKQAQTISNSLPQCKIRLRGIGKSHFYF